MHSPTFQSSVIAMRMLLRRLMCERDDNTRWKSFSMCFCRLNEWMNECFVCVDYLNVKEKEFMSIKCVHNVRFFNRVCVWTIFGYVSLLLTRNPSKLELKIMCFFIFDDIAVIRNCDHWKVRKFKIILLTYFKIINPQ